MATRDSARRTEGQRDLQSSNRVTTFRTATGSTYEIDCSELTWRRVPTFRSGVLRSELGRLVAVRPLEVGLPGFLLCPPFQSAGPPRAIITTLVVAIEGCADQRCVGQVTDCPWKGRLRRGLCVPAVAGGMVRPHQPG